MPAIQFDVLIPDTSALQLQGVFEGAVNDLVEAGRLASGSVTHDHAPTLREGIEDGLRLDRDDLHTAGVHRYVIRLEGLDGSVNQLAMALSRFLTPEVELPPHPELLELDGNFEVAATYPWAVEIRR